MKALVGISRILRFTILGFFMLALFYPWIDNSGDNAMLVIWIWCMKVSLFLPFTLTLTKGDDNGLMGNHMDREPV